MLSGCGPLRTIEVPVPVRVPVDARLTVDCVPRYNVPAAGQLPVQAAMDRLAAVEDALAQCRAQLEALRGVH